MPPPPGYLTPQHLPERQGVDIPASVKEALYLLRAEESSYEHRVASFGTTLINEVFFYYYPREDNSFAFISTPEKKGENNSKKPDYAVRAINLKAPQDYPERTTPRVFVEFKKVGGDPTYKALYQLVESVKGEVDTPVYLMVQAGFRISFWVFDPQTYRGENPNQAANPWDYLWGCRSLTQNSIYPGDEKTETPFALARSICPVDDRLYIHAEDKGKTKGEGKWKTQWEECLKYHEGCIFDLEKDSHLGWVVEMVLHMAKNKPTPLYDGDMQTASDEEMENEYKAQQEKMEAMKQTEDE